MTFAVRFCSACGAALGGPPPVRCAACGAEHWRNAKPCGGALIERDGRLLLVRRAIDPEAGRWDIPGGFCEAEEHPRDAAVREAREETGLEVRATALLGLWIDRYGPPAADGTSITTLNAYYVCVPVHPAAVPAPDRDEVTATAWFGPAELPPADLAFGAHAGDVLQTWVARGR